MEKIMARVITKCVECNWHKSMSDLDEKTGKIVYSHICFYDPIKQLTVKNEMGINEDCPLANTD